MWRVARGCFLGPLSSWWHRPARSQVSTPADRDLLSSLFADADAASSSIKTQSGIARFPSVASWIHTDVKGWSPLGQLLDEEQFEQLLTEAKTDLGSFVTKAGRVEFLVDGDTILIMVPWQGTPPAGTVGLHATETIADFDLISVLTVTSTAAPVLVFGDGFEGGDLTGWSSHSP